MTIEFNTSFPFPFHYKIDIDQDLVLYISNIHVQIVV